MFAQAAPLHQDVAFSFRVLKRGAGPQPGLFAVLEDRDEHTVTVTSARAAEFEQVSARGEMRVGEVFKEGLSREVWGFGNAGHGGEWLRLARPGLPTENPRDKRQSWALGQ